MTLLKSIAVLFVVLCSGMAWGFEGETLDDISPLNNPVILSTSTFELEQSTAPIKILEIEWECDKWELDEIEIEGIMRVILGSRGKCIRWLGRREGGAVLWRKEE